MLCAERAAWRDREDAMMEAMNETWHWRQQEEDYHDQLQSYYTARFAHQQHVYRLNQVLYGNSIACALREQGDADGVTQPPQQQQQDVDMACSPVPRSPLQPHAHANLPGARHPAVKKRSAEDSEGGWAAGPCHSARLAKRHHR